MNIFEAILIRILFSISVLASVFAYFHFLHAGADGMQNRDYILNQAEQQILQGY